MPFGFLKVEGAERQTMDRFIAVLKAHNIRASALPDYTPWSVFRRLGYFQEKHPRVIIETDIRKGRNVQANRDRLYWLGFEPPDPAA